MLIGVRCSAPPGLEAAGKHGGEAGYFQARVRGGSISLCPINVPEKELQYSVIARGKLSVNSTINIFLTFMIASTMAQSIYNPSAQQGCTSPFPIPVNFCEQSSMKGRVRKKYMMGKQGIKGEQTPCIAWNQGDRRRGSVVKPKW